MESPLVTKIEINQVSAPGTLTLKELRNGEFENVMAAFNTENRINFLLIPSCDSELQNTLIFISEDNEFDAVDFDSWDDDEEFFVKEVLDLHLKLTV